MEVAEGRELSGLAVLNRRVLLLQCPCKQHWIGGFICKYDA